MSSPPVAPPRACADGIDRVRIFRARKSPAGFLALAASFLLLLAARNAAAQFPIRQLPPRLNQATQPPATPAPRTNALPAQYSAAPAQPAQPPHPAVARITVPEKGAVSYGSGTLVDVRGQHGLVITNWHVVRDVAGGAVSVRFPDGFESEARVERVDVDWDLAALSIRRPPVAPVAITGDVPRLGEWLTIAGYGSGDYRAATGTLSAFGAPSQFLPEEILELAHVEARQGDSGGPILNQRGEMCGVLFGAREGNTNGSHGGRVLKFLAAVVPGGVPGNDGLPAASALATNPPPTPSLPQTTALHQNPPPVPLASSPSANQPPSPSDGWSPRQPEVATNTLQPRTNPLDIPLLAPPPPRDSLTPQDDPPAQLAAMPPAMPRVSPAVAAELDESPPLIHSTLPSRLATPVAGAVDVNTAPPAQLAAAIWRQVGGTTAVDQGKSILAIIGVLSLLVFGWRISSQREPEPEED